MKKQNIIAIIIARGGSKSIPRKNVLLLHGKPLVAWPIDLAKSIKRIDRVIVTTDDDEIMSIAKKYGAEVPFKRPAELATDEVTTLPVLQHCVKYLEDNENYKADIVVLLYPTAPFLRAERIERALDRFEQTDCDSVISVIKDWGRFWKEQPDGSYKPFHPEKRVNRQYYKPLLREDGAIYFSRYDVLMKQDKLVSDDKVDFVYMDADENVDIDNPHDLLKAQNTDLGSELKKDSVQLRGEHLMLRTLRPDDISDEYVTWLNDAELQEYTRRRGKKTSKIELEAFLRESLDSRDWHFAIFDENKKHIGNVFLNHMDLENKNADLSIMIGDKNAHGKRYAQEAIKLVTAFAFDQLKLHRIYASSPSPAFNRMIEKVGWQHEGDRKESFLIGDTYHDLVCWSILNTKK